MKRALLSFEFILLCIFLPTIIIVFRLAPFMFALLWGTALYCYLVLRIKYPEHLKDIWKWREVNWANLRPMLIRWVIASFAMLAFIYIYDPEKVFNLFYRRPEIIPFLLVMYPVVSGLPQEFIFCSFFFKRYERFFPSQRVMIVVSAVVFAYAHMLFINPVAPALSFIAGLIFANTYAKTKSLALVAIEHGLYGNVLFLVGLGWYFYSGAVVVP